MFWEGWGKEDVLGVEKMVYDFTPQPVKSIVPPSTNC
jgi:hypothetical protein